ncbi:hypothetical protein CB0940_03244 [Cercospora beticola]|uniref:Uncharacterized protein n=1 Tax=Cercospora beticola TaxID=122368 RepID=A0A2G5I4Z9_CERBT|nr:hypothetical protein CB0940_03244 [Cercospora beticola]PIA99553.1 hypothetical protein CB0940_03244 [Cercospora beticola]WPB00417.1 hypothetical protein RHO25_005036 [Cercospora beticola]CAK1361371.1 unnamed protein product [Cercospora beticola]
MATAKNNIAREQVRELKEAPLPLPGVVLQLRTGKKQAFGPTQSAINKLQVEGSIFAGKTGLDGDEHVYKHHGGIDRAIHQYNPDHYADWRAEEPPAPALFDIGGFGENLTTTNMNEENVCVGDLYRLGEEIILQVSEPRNPCYKLNIRFQWPRVLKRVQRTGRVGWNFRVLQTGYVKKGDTISLLERPHPKWSVMNVQRAIKGKAVPLSLVEECSELEVLTSKFRDMALHRLRSSPKRYAVTKIEQVTPRVKQLTFSLLDTLKLSNSDFEDFAFAQLRFGPDLSLSRSYSIVSGNMKTFCLGVALDDQSRGGSAYLHQQLRVGDEVQMVPGDSPKAVADEKSCEKDGSIAHRLIIIGDIGVTAFLPKIKSWQQQGVPLSIHYAVRSDADAAYANDLPKQPTTTYSKTRNERLEVESIIPPPSSKTKLYCCGPARLMQACKQLTDKLGYPENMVHFEDFTAPRGDDLGDPFEVEVDEPDTKRKETLVVPSDKTLLQVLHEAGFDNVMSSCETGGCGACKVTLCAGKVAYNSQVLSEEEKKTAMQSCVDRGVGKIKIEID